MKKLPIGTLRCRDHYGDGRKEAFIKVRHIQNGGQACWEPLARVVWEKFNGPIPPGVLIGHKNGNGCDCRRENLFAGRQADLLSLSLHRHWGTYIAARRREGLKQRHRMPEVWAARRVAARRRRQDKIDLR